MNRFILAIAASLLGVSTAYGKVTYLHSNPQGSIVAATDESGNQLWVKRYTPYGIESEAVGIVSDSGANHGYAIHEVDKETALVYMKARYYDPVIGKFYSTDPFAIGSNHYLYVQNNPLNFYDPSGCVTSYGALLMQGIGIVGNGVGMAAGIATFGAGVFTMATTSPTAIGALAGVGLMGLGTTGIALSADGLSENMWAMYNNINETSYARQSSLKSDIFQYSGASSADPWNNAIYDSISLGLSIPGGRISDSVLQTADYLRYADYANSFTGAGKSIWDSSYSIGGSFGYDVPHYSNWEEPSSYGLDLMEGSSLFPESY